MANLRFLGTNFIIILIAYFAIGGCGGGGVDGDGDGQQLQINSLSTASAPPASLLKITGSGFDPNAELIIRFSDGEDFIVDMLVIVAITTAVTSSVPSFFNLTTGEFATRTVDVQVVQKSGAITRTSNVITGFQIQVPPTSPLPPGRLTLGYLFGALIETIQQSFAIIGTPLDTPELNSSLASQKSNLNFLIDAYASVVNNPGTSVTVGTIDGIPVTIDSTALINSDRQILALLTVQASFVSANGTTSLLPSPSFTISSTGSGEVPQAQSAEEILDALENEMLLETDWDSYFSSMRNSLESPDIPNVAEYSLVTLGLSVGLVAGVGVGFIAGAPASVLAGILMIGAGLNAIGVGLGFTDPAEVEAFSDLTSKVVTSASNSLSEFNERVVGPLKEIIESSTEVVTEVIIEIPPTLPPPPPPPPTETPFNNQSCGGGKTCKAGDCGFDNDGFPIQCTSCNCEEENTPTFHCHCQPGNKKI